MGGGGGLSHRKIYNYPYGHCLLLCIMYYILTSIADKVLSFMIPTLLQTLC